MRKTTEDALKVATEKAESLGHALYNNWHRAPHGYKTSCKKCGKPVTLTIKNPNLGELENQCNGTL